MTRHRWTPYGLAAWSIALALTCSMLSGCGAARTASRAAFDEIRTAVSTWWKEEGEARARAGGAELADAAERRAIAAAKDFAAGAEERARSYADSKLGEIADRLRAHGAAVDRLSTLPDLVREYQAVRHRERDTGTPYAPVTGSLLTDLIALMLGTRYLGKGADLAISAGIARVRGTPDDRDPPA